MIPEIIADDVDLGRDVRNGSTAGYRDLTLRQLGEIMSNEWLKGYLEVLTHICVGKYWVEETVWEKLDVDNPDDPLWDEVISRRLPLEEWNKLKGALEWYKAIEESWDDVEDVSTSALEFHLQLTEGIVDEFMDCKSVGDVLEVLFGSNACLGVLNFDCPTLIPRPKFRENKRAVRLGLIKSLLVEGLGLNVKKMLDNHGAFEAMTHKSLGDCVDNFRDFCPDVIADKIIGLWELNYEFDRLDLNKRKIDIGESREAIVGVVAKELECCFGLGSQSVDNIVEPEKIELVG